MLALDSGYAEPALPGAQDTPMGIMGKPAAYSRGPGRPSGRGCRAPPGGHHYAVAAVTLAGVRAVGYALPRLS